MSASESLAKVRTPLQDDFQLINRGDPPTRKRKSIDDTSEGLEDYITIRDVSTGTIRKLRPKKVIHRAALPLAYIDFNNSSKSPQPLLVSTYIWSLEGQRGVETHDYLILVAQDEENSLVVVEKVSKGVYTLVRLAKWVSLQDLDRKAVKQRRIEPPSHENSHTNAGPWWQSAAVQIPPTPRIDQGRLTEFVLADKAHVQHQSIEPPQQESIEVPASVLQCPTVEVPSIPMEAESIDWTLKIREHYLEALYASRASLAYFVKGPLSRARIAHQTINQDRSLADLLRTNILSVKVRSNVAVIDKKYNKGIPDVINEIPSGITSEESSETIGLSQDRISKSRRRKKITLEGMLPGEEEHIIKWWIRREGAVPHEGSESTRDQRIKRAITEQKARETQLQIIIILEVMALETQDKPSAPGETQSESQTQPLVAKEKKPLDLSRALDTLVEKLQIWETMNEDTIAISTQNGEKFSENSNSCLRAFCLDIVLPFYIARLPDVSKDFCRKFGVVLSPEKKPTRTISSGKTKKKHGEIAKDRPSRKPLDRVLTGEGILSKRKPASLTRSATDSLVPFIKEELQEVSLAKIPAVRQSIHQSKFYARREVDLTAEVKATEAKLKRRAEIEQELKGAIFALRKPNARLAVKEYVDASDQRTGPQKGRSRKSQNPMRNPFADGVQVTATPKINRHKTYPVAGSGIEGGIRETEPHISPPSSVPLIPSSTRKPFNRKSSGSGHLTISFTPSKSAKTFQLTEDCMSEKAETRDQRLPLVQFQIPADHHGNDSESEPELPSIKDSVRKPYLELPIKRSTFISATPIKRSNLTRSEASTSEDNPVAVFTTPRKSTPPTSSANILVSSPLQKRHLTGEVVENNPSKDKDSIYDMLGWDNDFDL